MKYIYGLLGDVPKSEYSHNAAWARMWSNLIEAEIAHKFPISGDIYFYININYTGSLNLFGGVDKTVYDRLESFIKYIETNSGKVYILEHDMPDLGVVLKSRIGNASSYEGLNEEFCLKLTEACSKVQTVKMTFEDDVIIGDSHSISMAKKGQPVIRLDAKTLYGAINGEEGKFINNRIPKGIKNITLMFGSIDIRHHLFRQEKPYEATEKLFTSYFDKVKELQEEGYKVQICTPVPIELESRKMAKTTMYKGDCFYGSRNDRLKLTKYVIKYMKDNAPCEVISYPTSWYDMDPRMYEANIMERPRSIHVGYPNYRMNNFGEESSTFDDF